MKYHAEQIEAAVEAALDPNGRPKDDRICVDCAMSVGLVAARGDASDASSFALGLATGLALANIEPERKDNE